MKRLMVVLLLLIAGTAQAAGAKSYYVYFLKLVRKDAIKTGFTDGEKQIMKAHAAYHAQLTKDGIELVAGPTIEDDPIGIAIISASSAEEAMGIMKSDPAVAGGVMTGTVHPFELAFGTAAAPPTKK